MNQQEQLEAQYKAAAAEGDVPREDPFPRMIVVCIGITIALLFIILGCLFVDFVVLRPKQNVRSAPVPAVAPEEAPAETPAPAPARDANS